MADKELRNKFGDLIKKEEPTDYNQTGKMGGTRKDEKAKIKKA